MSGLVDHVLDLMRPWAPVVARRMFGGHGLYRDGVFFALIAAEALYLKADAASEARFRAAGCTPFVYHGATRQVTMGYWSVPAACLESPGEMAAWCELAWQAALRKPARPRHRA